MSSLNELAKQFVNTNNYPLETNKRIKGFISEDKRKIQFLENIKKFRENNPKLNFLELGEAIEINTYGKKGNRNFKERFQGLVRFMNNPQDIRGLELMTKGLQDIGEATYEGFNPSRFEEFSKEPKIIYEIPIRKETEEIAAVSTEDISEVVSKPKIRGGSVAKEMKEMKEDEERKPREDVTERVAKMEKIEKEQMEKEDKLSKTRVDSMGNTFETEDDPRVIEIEPSTMSPDERDKEADMFLDSLINETVEEIEANKPPPSTAVPATTIPAKTTPATATTIPATTPATALQPQTSDKTSPTGKVEDIEIKDIPQDVLSIPKERASTKGKSEEQLINDIEYFFKTYPEILDIEKNQFNKIQRGKSPALRKKQLMELHRRIVGKIGKIEDDEGNKRIGIILNANKYLDDKINAILLQKLTEGLTPESLVVDVSDKTETDSSKRVGSYQITKGRSGLLNAQKAPIYRSIPTTNKNVVLSQRDRGRPIELKTLPTQRWDEVNTAKKKVRLDPFIDTNKRPNRFNIYL